MFRVKLRVKQNVKEESSSCIACMEPCMHRAGPPHLSHIHLVCMAADEAHMSHTYMHIELYTVFSDKRFSDLQG